MVNGWEQERCPPLAMKRPISQLLTGNVIALSVATAGVILVAVGLLLSLHTWDGYRAALEWRQDHGTIHALLDATEVQARERGHTAAWLGDAEAASRPDALWLESDLAWQAALLRLARLQQRRPDDTGLASRAAAVHQALARKHTIRARLAAEDNGLGTPSLPEDWFEATTQLNEQTIALQRYLAAGLDGPPEVMRLALAVNHPATELIEYQGRIRGLFAWHLAAAQPLDSAHRRQIEIARSLADQRFTDLTQTAAGMDPSLDHLLEAMGESRQEFLISVTDHLAAADEGHYLQEASDWLVTADAAIGAVFAFARAGSDLALSGIESVARSRATMLGSYVALMLLAAVLALLSLRRLRRDMERYSMEKEMSETILGSVADAVLATDAQGRIHYLNPAAEQLTGWSLPEAMHRDHKDVVVIRNRLHASINDPLTCCLEQQHIVSFTEGQVLVRPDGEEIAIDSSCAPIRDAESTLQGCAMVFSPRDREHTLDRMLSYHASRDTVTGLYNRRAFEQHLQEFVHDARSTGRRHSLAFIDLDNFKAVNDLVGHAAGDQLLRQIAWLIGETVRDTDVTGRLGGDEFGLLLRHCPVEQAKLVANKLHDTLRRYRLHAGDRSFDVGMSIGLVEIGPTSPGVEELIHEADTACYTAKEAGRNRARIYHPSDRAQTERRRQLQWVTRLTDAMDEDHFILFGQPIVPVREGLDTRAEILLRLQDADGNLIPPMAFLPAAERHGLMPEIDRHVIRKAFRLLARHKAQSTNTPIIHINLSALSLADQGTADFLLEQVQDFHLDPSRLCLEVTETAVMGNLQQTARTMERLRDEGFQLALDDFGSGLSSLTWLKNLPVHLLKIDGNFVRGIVQDPIDHAMVEAISRIGELMGIHTCAESVESARIMEALPALNIEYAQGFHPGRPWPLVDLLGLPDIEDARQTAGKTMPPSEIPD